MMTEFSDDPRPEDAGHTHRPPHHEDDRPSRRRKRGRRRFQSRSHSGHHGHAPPPPQPPPIPSYGPPPHPGPPPHMGPPPFVHPPEPPRPPRRHRGHKRHKRHETNDSGDTMFGVRRPLRFLARKLDLDQSQIEHLAGVLDDLKIEYAQVAVDNRRAQKLFVECIQSEAFDAEKAQLASTRRIQTQERLQTAITETLRELHSVLDEEQRTQLAYLIRSGDLTF